jgi:cytosine/adenosine deaminase-related metal-dependent hydrolase
MSPQWVSDEILQEIKHHAEQEGLRIHIHVQQTQLQQHYGMIAHGKSLLAHLAGLGFLGENVTCGHCVWLSEDDISVLADTGTSVTHHPACNLRVRNGISPVFEMLKKGITVAIGMDDKEFGDKKDFIEELRLVSKLHRLPSHRLASDHLRPADCFRMGTEYGASVLGFSDRIGTLVPNKKADLVLLDLCSMMMPFTFPDHNIIDVLTYRGSAADIDTVMVNGEILIKNGEPTKIDKQEKLRKLKESIPADYAKLFQEGNKHFPALRDSVAAYFDPWHEALEFNAKTPYYFLNNR